MTVCAVCLTLITTTRFDDILFASLLLTVDTSHDEMVVTDVDDSELS